MTRLRYNGLSTTLGGSLTASATSVTFSGALTHSGGLSVPSITGSDYIPLTILDSAGKVSEIVYLTVYTSGATSGTITRAQEGTNGATHAAGDKVTHSATVSDFASAPAADTSIQIVGTVFGQGGTMTVPGGVVATDYAVLVAADSGGPPSNPSGWTQIANSINSGGVFGNGITASYRTGLASGDTVGGTAPANGIVFIRNMTAPPTAEYHGSVNNGNGNNLGIPARSLNLGQMELALFSQTGTPANPGPLTPPAGWVLDGSQLAATPFYARASIAHSFAGGAANFTTTSQGAYSLVTVTLPGQLAADSPYALYQAKDVTTDTPLDRDVLAYDAPSGQWKPMSGTRKVNAQTGTAYTLALADAGAFVTLTNGSATTLTVPTNASVAFPVGTVIDVAQLGAGLVTLAGASGVTVNAAPGLKSAGQFSEFSLLKTATDTWLAYGRLAA